MGIAKVRLDNLDEERRFSKLVSELFPDNENFRNLSSDLQRFLLKSAVEDGYADDSYVGADGYDSYFQYYYPVTVGFCSDEYDDVDLLSLPNCVDDWYWMSKDDVGMENLVDCVSVSEFEEMFRGCFGITLGYLSRLTVAGRTPSVTVVDEEDGDASVEWGFKNGNGKQDVRVNVSRSGENDNWRLSFVYCAEPCNYDIDLNADLTDREEFEKLFAFVSARIEKILNIWEQMENDKSNRKVMEGKPGKHPEGDAVAGMDCFADEFENFFASVCPDARLQELTRKDIGDFRVLGVLPCVTEGVRDYIAEWVVDGDCHIHATVEEMRNSGCWDVRVFEYGKGYIPGVKHESVVKYRQEFVLFMASVLAKYKLEN